MLQMLLHWFFPYRDHWCNTASTYNFFCRTEWDDMKVNAKYLQRVMFLSNNFVPVFSLFWIEELFLLSVQYKISMKE